MEKESISIRELLHSLRNPLTAILSNLKIIRQSYKISDELIEIIDELIFNSEYLEILMKNASDIYKIQDKNDLLFFRINLNEVIDYVIEKISVIYQNYKDLLEIKYLKKNIILNINTDMLQRFFIIIIIELLKFTTTDNKLLISFDSVNKNLVCQIKIDNYEDEILNSKKIFTELFIKPKQKAVQLHYAFYNKFLKLHQGEIKLIKIKNIHVLEIKFALNNI